MLRPILAAALLFPLPSWAAENTLRFTLGGGAGVAPAYFGSDEWEVSPTGSLSVGYVDFGGVGFGSLEGGRTPGLGFTGAFRVVPERSAADYPELAGLDDVDLTVELGPGVVWTAETWEAFANIRYGFGGHESVAGTLGADAIARQGRWTFTAGPRVEWGSGRFMNTYFGVDAAEAGASGLAEYDPSGGIWGAGVALGAEYRMSPDWSVEGNVQYLRLLGDAADSPITGLGDEDQVSASVLLKRTFTLEF